MAEVILSRKKFFLHIEGFIFYKHSENKKNNSIYWKCRDCVHRMTTFPIDDPVLDGAMVEIKGRGNSKLRFCANNLLIDSLFSDKRDHTHEPNFVKVGAKKIVAKLKKTAVKNPSMLPSQILKDVNILNVPEEIAAYLPSTHNIKQTMLREKAKKLPSNPRTIEDLELIPRVFSVTKDTGEFFLLYDSCSDEDYLDENGRILIFATESNLRMLFKSDVWFADGTFKSAPSIFYQLFTIMGKFPWMHLGKQKTAVRPFVYALLENKAEFSYKKVQKLSLLKLRN